MMFIIPNLHIISIAVLVAAPFYFFNRYLVQKIRPEESGKKLTGYFVTVIITALIYSIIGVILMVWIAKSIK
jgi:hypothetical protein